MTQGLLRIYVEDKDGKVISFPPNEEQAVVKDWTRTAERMAGAPSVTGTVMHKLCLDNLWTKKEFVVIGGERYYVKQVPTSSKDTEDVRYKHDVTLVGERDILENVYFFDVVTKREDAQESDKPRSNTTDFSFTGDLKELVERLNDSLSYSKIYDAEGINGFCIVIDDDVEIGEAQEVSITDAYFATAMQEIYNVFGVPYYWVGKICHVGYAQNEIEKPFEYGKDNGLLSVSKNNSEYRLINRITGMGSADNIPYYYPNTDPNGEPIITIKNMDRANIKSIQLTTINAKFGGSVGKTFCLGNIKEGNATTELFNDDKTLNGIAKYAAPYEGEDEGGNYYTEDPVDSQEEQLPMILEFEFYAYVNDEIDASSLSINTSYEISGATTTIAFNKGSQPYWGQTCTPTPIENWDARVSVILPEGIEDPDGPITANDKTYRCKKQGVHKLIINCTPSYRVSMHPASKPGALSWATIDWYCHINGSIKFKTFYGDVIYQSGRVFKIEESGISIIGDDLPKLDLVLRPSQDYGSFDAHIIGGSTATCAQFTIKGIDFINPISKLMPYVYREQKGAERFYNAVNDKYLKENGEYYSFNNPYLPNEPLEGKQDFEDIKPTINGITNAQGQLFGEVADIAFDETDSDDLAIEEGDTNSAKLVHSYFYIKLHKFDGDYGFNLFKQGLSKGAMTLNFISGSCAGCAFEVGVSKPSQVDNHYEFENPIQVDELGNIVAGDYDDKVKEGNPIESQQDTTTNEVWIALKKDQSTFGVVMPNATNDYKPKAGDKFVITNILLPQVYITAAEKRLEAALIKYMSENNDEKFTFSIKFSRIYLQKHIEDIVPYLNENARINVKYNNTIYPLYVSSYTQKYDGNILDEISVELSEKLTIAQSKSKEQMDSIMGNVNEQINSALKGNNNNTQQGVTDGDLVAIKNLLNNKLSKVTSDTAQGLITFIKGLVAEGRITANEGIRIGDFVAGFIGGMGGMIDKDGNAELKSLRLREFLEVPELRFNRIDVVSGELWNSICFGTIESVDTKRRIAVLKLQDGELSGIKVGDICRGIFHCLEAGNPSESKEDDCGFLQLAGFSTSYFTPTEVYDNGASFKYTLRSGTSVHPQVGMKFAVYGSFTDKTRRASAYMTRTYTRYLNNVDTWQIRPDVHIYGQQGDIEGLTINGVEMHGYGAYLHNLYLSGVHIEFDRDWIDHNIPKTYNVVLTTYERTVVTDIEGNPLTGLEEIRNIISEDGNVVSGESNVIANRLALTTTIQASKGSTPLLYSDIMDEGRFVVSLQCIGCTAKCENGVVMVTSLDMESMEHQVVIEVNCEGEAVYQQIFNVPVVKQGENGVTADLDNEMATIAANDKGKPIVEPFEEIISHGRLWYGNEEMYLVKAEVAVPGGINVADVTTVTDEEGQHNYLPIVDNKYCTLRITDVGEDAADISQIRIELFGRIKEQMNTEYSKVVVFTLNKVRMGENAQNYSLLTTSPIMQADGKGNVTTTQVTCSVLVSDGKTMTELTTADELTEHTLTMKVQLYNANDAVSEDVAYTIGTNLVVGTSTIGGLKLTKDSVRLVFLLYWQGLLIDKEGIPMIKDGSSTVRIDLDNENDSILYDGNGKALTDPCVTNITVWDGGKDVTSQCTISVEDSSGVEGSFTNDSHTQYKVTAITSQTGYVRFKAYYPADKNSYNTVFSLKRIVGADKYEIVTMPTSVNYDPNKKEYSASSITVNVNRIDQGGTRTENSLPSGFSLQYSTDGSLWTAMAAGAGISPDYTKPNIYLRVVDSNGNVYDAETVNVMIGGLDGVAITSVKEFYCISSSNSSAPDASLFVDYFVAPTSYNRYLWNFERVFYSDGKTQDTTPAVIGTYAEDGADGRSITGVVEQYGLSSDKNTQPTSWYSYPLTTDSVNRYLWNREYCQFSDGSSTAWTIPCIIGVYGDKGDTGETGAPGQNGVTYDIVTDISTMWPYTDGVNVSIRKTDGVNVSTISLANIQSYGMSLRAYINATNISNYIEYTSDSQIYWGSNVSVVIGNVLKIQLVNGISSYTQVLAEKTIPCIGYGYNGSQGDRGPALRGPQYWDNLPSGYEFYKGASGEQFIDVVMYKGEFYLCTGSHSKSSSYYPGSYYSNLYGYWTKGSQFELIATKVILSEYALINNLGASAIEMKDSNGNVVFLAKDGNVTCNNGTFNNVSVNGTINSNEGNIGGFTLGSNSLTSDKGDAYISFPLTGSSFLHLNAPTAGALISARNDGGKACSLSAYGNNSFGLDIMAQAGYNTMALQSYGNANLVARNGEQIKVTGLNVSVHTITSSSDTIKGCDDFVVFSTGSSGTYAMPSASSYPGKVIYVKKLSGSSMTGLTGNFRKPESSTGTTSETFCAEGVSMMYISDGTRWNVFYCG